MAEGVEKSEVSLITPEVKAEGLQVKPGFKSMAYSLTFRAKDHTLTEDEITSVMNKILNGLTSMNIELRS